MTLLNVIRQKDRVHLLTDGAGLKDGDLVASVLSKNMVFPHLNMAIGFRGINQVGKGAYEFILSGKIFSMICS